MVGMYFFMVATSSRFAGTSKSAKSACILIGKYTIVRSLTERKIFFACLMRCFYVGLCPYSVHLDFVCVAAANST